MTATSTLNFEAPYKEQLTELAGLIDWLQSEHDQSFVKAGDDKVFAFGGGGFVVVLDERVWMGLIELVTPGGSVSIKPGDDGKIKVTSTVEGEAATKQIIKDGVEGIRRNYENRYWSTPKTPS
jgi:hypothetical protein